MANCKVFLIHEQRLNIFLNLRATNIIINMPDHPEHEKYMRRCLDLALQAGGAVAPNPMVGSVLVYEDLIIGEGYHRAFGHAHAEVNAIYSVKRTELLKGSRLYVNLEPCSHHGKTPPCTDLLIKHKIPEIVIGVTDPNPLVSGRGVDLLRKSGAEVIAGVLKNECSELNRRFFTWHVKKRPYIILKWARSADGFIDFERPAIAPVGPNWITSPTARILVHKWRTEEQAILVGTNTVIKDNPRLNVRDWAGKNPLRVLIDRELKLGSQYNVFDNSQETLVFTAKELPAAMTPGTGETKGISMFPGNPRATGKIRYARISFDDTAENQILDFLYRENIQSLIVEGGAYTLKRFIEKDLWDEARIFTGPAFFKSGIKSPEITGGSVSINIIGNSQLQVIRRESRQ
jgi:diaminohydroxyphosphoribosylaminopyrimidine deaminase / 5-amino-6-(5-phosphoribosylamino)uracil reductase